MKNLGLGDLSVLAYGLNLAGYWPPCFKFGAPSTRDKPLLRLLRGQNFISIAI